MDINIIQQIEQCSLILQKIKDQKLHNINLLGDSLDNLEQMKASFNSIEPRDIVEIKCNRNPLLVVKLVLELSRILTHKNVNIPTVEKTSYRQEQQTLECDIMKPTPKEEQSVESLDPNFLYTLNKLSVFSVNEETLELLESYNYLKNHMLTFNYARRASNMVAHLLNYILNIQAFCEFIKPIKQNINLCYPPISQQIQQIQQNLTNQQVQLEVQQQLPNVNQTSKVEIGFEEILKNLQKYELSKFQSSFIHYFRYHFDLKEWIKNKRPLNYWQMIDNQSESEKLNELVKINFFNKNNLQGPYSYGYDFLMLLKDSELKQIQNLHINLYHDMNIFLENCYPIQQMNLKSLTLGSSFSSAIFEKEQAFSIILELVKSSQKLQEFSIQLSNLNQFTKLLELFEVVMKYETLYKLELDFSRSNITQEQIQSILNLTYQAKNLQKLQLKFPLREALNLMLFDGLNQLQQLRSFELVIFGQHNEAIFKLLTTALPGLQNLISFYVTIEEMFYKDIDSFKELRKALQKLKVNDLQMDFGWSESKSYKYEARNLYKLKQAVKVEVSPNLKYLFDIPIEEQIE